MSVKFSGISQLTRTHPDLGSLGSDYEIVNVLFCCFGVRLLSVLICFLCYLSFCMSIFFSCLGDRRYNVATCGIFNACFREQKYEVSH